MRNTCAVALVVALAAGPALAGPVTLAERDMDQVTAGGILDSILGILFPKPTPPPPPPPTTKTETAKDTGAVGNSTANATATTTIPANSNATTTRTADVIVLPGFSQGLTFSSIKFP